MESKKGIRNSHGLGRKGNLPLKPFHKDQFSLQLSNAVVNMQEISSFRLIKLKIPLQLISASD